MSSPVRRSCSVLLAGCLVIVAASATWAQAEVEGASATPEASASPALDEVATCQAPGLGEPSGRTGTSIASAGAGHSARAGRFVPIVEAEPVDPAYGCTFPVVERIDPFTGETVESFTFDDPRLPGVIRQVDVFETDLGRGDLREVTRERGVSTVGRLRPGRFTVVVVEHDAIPSDVAVNIFTNLDGRRSNDVPIGARTPDLPLAGVDGGYSVFGDRLFVTDFRDAPEYYTGDPRRFPFAALSESERTAFLIPEGGHGTTITPFVFANEAMHYIDILANGALPVQGTVPLLPGCLSQQIVHEPLVVGGKAASASTDWVTACFPVGDGLTSLVASFIGDEGPLKVGVSIDSFDPVASDPRTQKVYAEVSVGIDDLYVTFPSGLLQYGYHHIIGPVFDPTGEPTLDALLGAAAASLDEYLVPIAVTEAEGLIQGMEACLEPGEQAQEAIG